jgi:magnesium-transporting ATPase (P-type)
MLEMTSQGMRVIALAYKKLEAKVSQDQLEAEYSMENRKKVESGLVFLGLTAIYDPPRPTSAEAVQICHDAGIEVHMATGDHPSTAVSIALEIGILPKMGLPVSEILKRKDLAITAADFEKLTDEEVDKLTTLPRVLARCSPESKVKLIAALHRRNKFVAMTGDG